MKANHILPALLAAFITIPASALTWNDAGPTNNWSTAVGDTNWTGGVTWTNGSAADFTGAGEAVTLATAAMTAGTVNFSAGAYTLNTNGNSMAWNALAGTAGFTKSGAGTLTINGTGGASGTINLTGGQITVGGTTALGTTSIAADGGSTVLMANGYNIANAVSLANGAKLSTTAGSTVSSSISLGTGGGNLSGAANYGIFTGKITGGTAGTNSLTINAGHTELKNTANDFAGNILLSGAYYLKTTISESLPDNAIINFSNANAAYKIQPGSAGTYTETIGGINSAVGAFGVFAEGSVPGVIVNLRVGAGDATSSYNGPIYQVGGAVLNFEKIGAGTFTFTSASANTYTGLTTVTGGALNIGSSGSLKSGNALTVGASGTADFANASQNLGAVSNSNTATSALNFSNATGTVVLASLTGAGNTRFGSNGTVTGGISTGTVTSVGALNANISGGTTTAGGLLTGTVSSGTVGAGSLSSTSVTGGTNIITGAAGITSLNGGATTVGGVATIGTLTSGTANLNGSTSSITTLNGGTVNLGSTTLTVGSGTTSGAITGASGALTVTGALVLTGSNTYGGITSVSTGGDLRVNGTNSGAGAVNIASGAKLGGSGSVIGGINVSGVLAPGNSIESLGGGALSFTTGSTYAYELQTNVFASTPSVAGDLTYSSGTLNIASGTILTLTDLGANTALANGSKLTLISSVGAWNLGLFSYDAGAGLTTIADDSTFTLGANTWTFNYNDTLAGSNFTGDTAGATNFVTLTVIPEPNVAALVGGLSVLALLRRRRHAY
jgi:fibronectin-binding autotransporter adhesin